MGINLVEIKYGYDRSTEQFAVIHTTTETMFAPTFDNRLEGLIWIQYYVEHIKGLALHTKFLVGDRLQCDLAGRIRTWLDEVAPEGTGDDNTRIPPQAWIDAVDPEHTYKQAKYSNGYHLVIEDIIDALDDDKRDVIAIVLDPFHAWMRRHPLA